MFQQLLEDVRGLVIGRAFAARPRRVEIAPIETSESQVTATQPVPQVQDGDMSGGKKKRKRR
jgi:hypothetical protein